MPEFPVTGPISVQFEIGSGRVEVTAEERPSALVEVTPHDRRGESRRLAEETTIEFEGDTLTVITPNQNGFRLRGGSVAIRVRVPLDSSLRGKSASADVTCDGRLGAVTIDSASGDLTADQIGGDATLSAASGDIRVGRVEGSLRSRTASGDVRAQSVGGDFAVKCASGDVTVEAVGGDISVETASGDISIGRAERGTTRINSASGDVRIGIRPGTGVWFDLKTLSGDTRNGLDMADGPAAPDNGNQISLQIRTLSGDIDIRRAAA